LSDQVVEAMIGVSLKAIKVYQEAKANDKAKGKAEEQLQEGRSLILKQMNRRLGQVSPALESQVLALSLVQLEALGEAVLRMLREPLAVFE
jgi:predicted transposase YdaD